MGAEEGLEKLLGCIKVDIKLKEVERNKEDYRILLTRTIQEEGIVNTKIYTLNFMVSSFIKQTVNGK